MKLIETIKSKYPVEDYIASKTGFQWHSVGVWSNLDECPLCSGHHCFRLNPAKTRWHCFQCYQGGDVIKFRALYENITYREAIEGFKNELGIKDRTSKDIEWVLIRQLANEYLTEKLFTCQTKYQFKGQNISPLDYLLTVRKHSLDAVLLFNIGFNDGGLIDFLKQKYSDEILTAVGLLTKQKTSIISEGCFTYPFTVNDEIKYFRIKDPNKIKQFQMPNFARSKECIWYNQDAIRENTELWVTEGEDDVISLWDRNIIAIASCGQLQFEQVNFLMKTNFEVIYLCFDNDQAGKIDTDTFVRFHNGKNIFIINLPQGKDIDDVIQSGDVTVEELRNSATIPAPEQRSMIRPKNDGYYIIGKHSERKLTNWVLNLEAVIWQGEEEKIRKCIIKSDKYQITVYIPSVSFSSASELRKFLLANCERLLFFKGSDLDLVELIHYLELSFNPKIVIESECVGEIEQGFITENVFVSNTAEILPLNNGFLALDENRSIRVVELVRRGGSRSELPYFPLIEPVGGIEKYKEKVFSLLVQNRNLKVALCLGWLKATLWSKVFYEKKRFFPLLCLHGKYQSGKSVLANWLMSILGLRTCNPEMLSDRGTTEVGLARKMAYYSSLPVFADDYRADETGARFHTFLRGVFDRTSPTKGLKEDFGVRRVVIRGCFMLTGEHAPADPALLSRMLTVELTKIERNDRYYKELGKLEPDFASIGFHWIKQRNALWGGVLGEYEALETELAKKIDDYRQVSVLALCLASILTEPFFESQKADLVDFAVLLSKLEIKERLSDEVIPILWEALDILKKRNELQNQEIYHDVFSNELQIHLPSLLSKIIGSQFTRHYNNKLPNRREIAKLLRQEAYVKAWKVVRIDNILSWRWILDLKHSGIPDIFKHSYEMGIRQDNFSSESG
jgi:hypothetical protein